MFSLIYGNSSDTLHPASGEGPWSGPFRETFWIAGFRNRSPIIYIRSLLRICQSFEPPRQSRNSQAAGISSLPPRNAMEHREYMHVPGSQRPSPWYLARLFSSVGNSAVWMNLLRRQFSLGSIGVFHHHVHPCTCTGRVSPTDSTCPST